MEQFHVISILGADARFCDAKTDLAQSVRDLNRKTLKLHARHGLSWLSRATAVAAIYLAGRFAVEGAVGGALSWTSGFLAVWVLWYLCKGHLLIQGDRQAKLYWLQNDADNREFSSNDPIVATMPAQEPMEPVRCTGSAAS